MIVKKLSKERLIETLHKHLIQSTEEEIRFVFGVFGFTLKECHFQKDCGINFEVHFKRAYIVRIVSSRSNILAFENEYVDFGEGAHGITMGQTETLAETLVVFVNMFMPNLLQSVGYEVRYDPSASPLESLEEAQEYLKLIQDEAQKIIEVKHPEPVAAPGTEQQDKAKE